MPVFAYGIAVREGLAEMGLLYTDNPFEPRRDTPCSAHELRQKTLEAAQALIYETSPDLRCCIRSALLEDPVVADDGQMYSRIALQEWWHGKSRFMSPKTGAVLANNTVRPVFAVKEHIQQLLDELIESGKAAALAGAEDESVVFQAVEIGKTMATLKPGEINPSDEFLGQLYNLCADAHLRDFAGTCGALGIATACFTARQNSVTADFLLRMLAFQADHQERLAFILPVAVAGLSGINAERHSLCFQVLSALVCDRRGVPDALLCELPRIFSPIMAKHPDESLLVRAEAPVPVFKSAVLFLLHLLVGKEDADLREIGGKLLQMRAPLLLWHVLRTVKDAEVVSLTCWLIMVLADTNNDMKATLRSTPGLLDELEKAAAYKDSAYLALCALAVFSEQESRCLAVLDSITSTPDWAANPRRVAKEAVDAMFVYPSPMIASLCFSILNNATCLTAAIVEHGVPSRANIVNYVLKVGVDAILEALYFACTQTHFETVYEGLCLLGNMATVVTAPGDRGWACQILNTAAGRISYTSQIIKIASCVLEVLKTATAQQNSQNFLGTERNEAERKEAQRTHSLRQGLAVLRQYTELTKTRQVAELQLKHSFIGWCPQEIKRDEAPSTLKRSNAPIGSSSVPTNNKKKKTHAVAP